MLLFFLKFCAAKINTERLSEFSFNIPEKIEKDLSNGKRTKRRVPSERINIIFGTDQTSIDELGLSYLSVSVFSLQLHGY